MQMFDLLVRYGWNEKKGHMLFLPNSVGQNDKKSYVFFLNNNFGLAKLNK